MLIRDIGTRIISTLLGIRHPRPTLWRGGIKEWMGKFKGEEDLVEYD